MFPRDRLLRAGASPAEVDHMEARSESEVLSIAQRLEGAAESGLHTFVAEYRQLLHSDVDTTATTGVDSPLDKPEEPVAPESTDLPAPVASKTKPKA